MYSIGIDVGSSYIKYCVSKNGYIEQLFMEKTPIRQKEYFVAKVEKFNAMYSNPQVVSCGYGKRNISGMNAINELTALAIGSYYMTKRDGVILDIGGQDTKIIFQKNGKLKEFFINDKCAAGSGMFLSNTLDMIGLSFGDIDLNKKVNMDIMLSSTCAVFAQSEIVQLIADNKDETEIIQAVIEQIFVKAKPLVSKISNGNIVLTGGLSQIPGIDRFATNIIGRDCEVLENGSYVAAIGCAFSRV